MDIIAIIILVIGVPLSLTGYLLTRAYCRGKSEQPRPRRVSRRADVFNSITDADLRAASDGATIAACLAASTVIIS